MVFPSGAMIALDPTVEILTTVRPAAIELLDALVGPPEIGVVRLREDDLRLAIDHRE